MSLNGSFLKILYLVLNYLRTGWQVAFNDTTKDTPVVFIWYNTVNSWNKVGIKRIKEIAFAQLNSLKHKGVDFSRNETDQFSGEFLFIKRGQYRG